MYTNARQQLFCVTHAVSNSMRTSVLSLPSLVALLVILTLSHAQLDFNFHDELAHMLLSDRSAPGLHCGPPCDGFDILSKFVADLLGGSVGCAGPGWC